MTASGPFPLKDTSAFSVVSTEQTTMRELIQAKSHTLREASYNGSYFGGSLGDIIADKFGGSDCAFGNWQIGGDDYSGHAPELVSDLDVSESSGSSSCSIEVAPGVEKTLRTSVETWQAIKDGRTIKSRCSSCSIELHCIDDAELVVCPDCWVAGPIQQVIGGIELECDGAAEKGPTRHEGISIGIREKDVMQWLDDI